MKGKDHSPVAARPGLWVGIEAALFDHRCPAGGNEPSTEFFVSAPCVVLVRRGAFRTTSSLGEVVADAGTAVFRNALSGYMVHDIPLVAHEATTVRIRASAAREMLMEVDPSAADRETPMFRRASGPATARTGLLHAKILAALAAGRMDDLLLEESVLKLAGLAIGGAYLAGQDGRVTQRSRACVDAARELMVRRAAEPLKLSDIAAGSGCSAWHLARSFAAVTGETIHRRLTRLRLSMGLEQLLDSCDGVTQIAVRCGFSDHSHFTAAFGREYGVTPSRARAMGLRELMARPRRQNEVA